MDPKSNGDLKMVITDCIEKKETDFSGWLLRFIPGGWFRKKWEKKWVVLKDEIMYMYEAKSNTSKRNLVAIDLLKYENCSEPDKNQKKKKPFAFILEFRIDANTANMEKGKKRKNILKSEFFCAENEVEKMQWLDKLNKAIVMAKQEQNKNLDHKTKSRAKPKPIKRRLPTRRHLREVATQSQMLPGIDYDTEINPDVIKRNSLSSLPLQKPDIVEVDSNLENNPSIQVEISNNRNLNLEEKPKNLLNKRKLYDAKSKSAYVEVSDTNRNFLDLLSLSTQDSKTTLDTRLKNQQKLETGIQSKTWKRHSIIPPKITASYDEESNKAASLDRRHLNRAEKQGISAENQSPRVGGKEIFLRSTALKLPGLASGDNIFSLKGKANSTTVLNDSSNRFVLSSLSPSDWSSDTKLKMKHDKDEE